MGNAFSGPPPKRSEARRRRNKPADGMEVMKVNLDEVLVGEVEIPAPPMKRAVDEDGNEMWDEETGEELWDYEWHPIALNLYHSLTRSGQALFYEPSDWHTAMAMCEALSREFNPKPIVVTSEDGDSHIQWAKGPVNGAVLGQVNKMLAALMATEGDRRRLRIELDRRKAQDAKLGGDGVVVSLVQSREELFSQ